jgi:hypothetical protein
MIVVVVQCQCWNGGEAGKQYSECGNCYLFQERSHGSVAMHKKVGGKIDAVGAKKGDQRIR